MESIRSFFEAFEERLGPLWQREFRLAFGRFGDWGWRTFAVSAIALVGTAFGFFLAEQFWTDFQSVRKTCRMGPLLMLGYAWFFGTAISVKTAGTTSLVTEIESKALFFLLSTPVSSLRVVLARLIPLWWVGMFPPLFFLPFFLLAAGYGGWRLTEIAILYGTLAVGMLFVQTLQLRAGLYAKDAKAAQFQGSWWFSLPAFLFFGPQLLQVVQPVLPTAVTDALVTFFDQPAVIGIMWFIVSLHPYGTLFFFIQTIGFAFPWPVPHAERWLVVGCVGQIMLTAFILFRTCQQLRPVAVGRMLGEPLVRVPLAQRLNAFFRRRRPAIWESAPIAWQTMWVGEQSVLRMTLWAILLLPITLLFISVWFWTSVPAGSRSDLHVVIVLTMMALPIVCLGSVPLGAMAIRREYKNQSLDSLLMSTLSNAEIVWQICWPALVPAALQMSLVALAASAYLLLTGVPWPVLVPLPFVVMAWLGLSAGAILYSVSDAKPDELERNSIYKISIRALFSVAVIAGGLGTVTYLVMDSIRVSDTEWQNYAVGDGLVATGWIWCPQSPAPNPFTPTLFLGVPALLLYAELLRRGWHHAVKRFGKTHHRFE